MEKDQEERQAFFLIFFYARGIIQWSGCVPGIPQIIPRCDVESGYHKNDLADFI